MALYYSSKYTRSSADPHVLEVAILDETGIALMHEHVRPPSGVPREHLLRWGIAPGATKGAPTFRDIYRDLARRLSGSVIYGYHLAPQVKALQEDAGQLRQDGEKISFGSLTWRDLFYGAYRHPGIRAETPSLIKACKELGMGAAEKRLSSLAHARLCRNLHKRTAAREGRLADTYEPLEGPAIKGSATGEDGSEQEPSGSAEGSTNRPANQASGKTARTPREESPILSPSVTPIEELDLFLNQSAPPAKSYEARPRYNLGLGTVGTGRDEVVASMALIGPSGTPIFDTCVRPDVDLKRRLKQSRTLMPRMGWVEDRHPTDQSEADMGEVEAHKLPPIEELSNAPSFMAVLEELLRRTGLPGALRGDAQPDGPMKRREGIVWIYRRRQEVNLLANTARSAGRPGLTHVLEEARWKSLWRQRVDRSIPIEAAMSPQFSPEETGGHSFTLRAGEKPEGQSFAVTRAKNIGVLRPKASPTTPK